jgi:hypothetical protein
MSRRRVFMNSEERIWSARQIENSLLKEGSSRSVARDRGLVLAFDQVLYLNTTFQRGRHFARHEHSVGLMLYSAPDTKGA